MVPWQRANFERLRCDGRRDRVCRPRCVLLVVRIGVRHLNAIFFDAVCVNCWHYLIAVVPIMRYALGQRLARAALHEPVLVHGQSLVLKDVISVHRSEMMTNIIDGRGVRKSVAVMSACQGHISAALQPCQLLL